jgi:hypothetical protein
LRAVSASEIYSLLEEAGLKVAAGAKRAQCPFEGCKDQRSDAKPNAHVGDVGGVVKVFCHRCHEHGDYVDLLQAVRGMSKAEAIEYVKSRGALPERPRPALPARPPPSEDDKLKPSEVEKLWLSLADTDAQGEGYLNSRQLLDALELRLVRFATEANKSPAIVRLASAPVRYRVGALLKDVLGDARGIQFRAVNPVKQGDSKIRSLKGSSTNAFFGWPELIDGATVVAVAEGLADTLATAIWAKGSDVVVVGAPGTDRLPKLALQLSENGIRVEGKLFALLVQNDKKHHSRKAFRQLHDNLVQLGAVCVFIKVPEKHKDVADWVRAEPDTAWPPAELERLLAEPSEGEDESPFTMTSSMSVPVLDGSAPVFGDNLWTLETILRDPTLRHQCMGPGELEFNEMTREPFFNRKKIKDSDCFFVAVNIQKTQSKASGQPLKFSVPEIYRACHAISTLSPFHPVRDYLERLDRFDGESLIDTQLAGALGLEEGADFELELVRRWLISAVARAMEPGCQADSMLVLQGKQGLGKSTFFSVLAGDTLFSEFSRRDMRDEKDGAMKILRGWIIEWAELAAIKGESNIEAVKGFITRRIERFRPPYGHTFEDAPRSCVFGGTTNEDVFLQDDTGNRRFWPVRIVKPINIAWFEANRDRLWAEAKALYKSGEAWHLDQELSEVLEQHSERFVGDDIDDAWSPITSGWIGVRQSVSIDALLTDAIGMRPENIERKHQMRVGKILRRLGWMRVRTRRNGTLEWVYVRPQDC